MRIAPRKSEPPSGSVIALQPSSSALTRPGTYRSTSSGVPQLAMVSGTVAACRFIGADSGG